MDARAPNGEKRTSGIVRLVWKWFMVMCIAGIFFSIPISSTIINPNIAAAQADSQASTMNEAEFQALVLEATTTADFVELLDIEGLQFSPEQMLLLEERIEARRGVGVGGDPQDEESDSVNFDDASSDN